MEKGGAGQGAEEKKKTFVRNRNLTPSHPDTYGYILIYHNIYI